MRGRLSRSAACLAQTTPARVRLQTSSSRRTRKCFRRRVLLLLARRSGAGLRGEDKFAPWQSPRSRLAKSSRAATRCRCNRKTAGARNRGIPAIAQQIVERFVAADTLILPESGQQIREFMFRNFKLAHGFGERDKYRVPGVPGMITVVARV